jgi:hypothetical protein
LARVLSSLVFVAGCVLALAAVVSGVILVVATRLAPGSAAVIGVGALVLVELSVAVSRALRVAPSGRGTQLDRLLVLVAVAIASALVAAVAVPASRPARGGLVIGFAGLVALVTVVGLQVVGRAPTDDQVSER